MGTIIVEAHGGTKRAPGCFTALIWAEAQLNIWVGTELKSRVRPLFVGGWKKILSLRQSQMAKSCKLGLCFVSKSRL